MATDGRSTRCSICHTMTIVRIGGLAHPACGSAGSATCCGWRSTSPSSRGSARWCEGRPQVASGQWAPVAAHEVSVWLMSTCPLRIFVAKVRPSVACVESANAEHITVCWCHLIASWLSACMGHTRSQRTLQSWFRCRHHSCMLHRQHMVGVTSTSLSPPATFNTAQSRLSMPSRCPASASRR